MKPLRPVRVLVCLLLAALALTGCGKAAGAPAAAHSAGPGLSGPAKKEIAMQLVSSAENSTLDWRGQYGYIEDLGDGRGYTAGIIGFCSGTGDLLDVVRRYVALAPGNLLAKYLPVLDRIMRLPEDQRDTHAGLDPGFVAAWQRAAKDPRFRQAQNDIRDREYFDPAVKQAKADGLRTLGQFIYYDAAVMHGFSGCLDIRRVALRRAKPPSRGGDEVAYLNAYLDGRVAEMRGGEPDRNVSRVDTEQRVFLRARNMDLGPPLAWRTFGDSYSIKPS